jgi:GAF domain-containing protein
MSRDEDLRAGVAAAVIGVEDAHAELLDSIVGVARAIFGAQAASVLLYDEQAGELEFAAVSGRGAGEIVGRRFPAGAGVAGWVLAARQPLVLEDVASDPRFARSVAEQTGFVPRGLMAVPLLRDERALGVLEVLDRPQRANFSLVEMELLGLFAGQAAIALAIAERARRAQAVLSDAPGAVPMLGALTAALEALDAGRRDAATDLLAALERLLRD